MRYEHDSDSSNDFSPAPVQQSPAKKSSDIKHSARLVCPLCSQHFDRIETTPMPFCSPRCKQIDLGRWLTESYGIPYEGDLGPEERSSEQ